MSKLDRQNVRLNKNVRKKDPKLSKTTGIHKWLNKVNNRKQEEKEKASQI